MHLICGHSPTQHRSANNEYGAGYTRNLWGQEERFIDVLPDESAVTPEDGAMRRVRAEGIRQVLNDVLTAHERDVLTLRFGLAAGSPDLLTAIGRRLGVTWERVRQIEVEALRKLRQPAVLGRLRAG